MINRYEDDELLDGVPPQPALRDAVLPAAGPSSPSSITMPKPSSAAVAVTGAGPAQALMQKMMQLEQMIQELGKDLPEVINAFAPGIQLMRDLGIAKLSDVAAGGTGATNPEAAALPSSGAGPMAGAGMPGMGMPPPPMI